MATDITTLAIALQSKEAEADLKTFNDLLVSGSEHAKRMEKMSIGVDVEAALKELAAFKASYEDIAKTAENIHFDFGFNMPSMLAPPPIAPTVDETALQELKAFFETTAEELRRQSELVSASMEKIGSGAERAGTTVRASGESMREATVAVGEYAEKLKELNAAKKEMEKTDAQSERAAKAAFDADAKAAEIKRELLQAQRELQQVSEKLAIAGARGTGFTTDLMEKEGQLRVQVEQLSEAYKKALSEADKFGEKLDISSEKAAEATAKYKQLQAELDAMPKPVAKTATAVNDFTKNAKIAGTTATKLARGFNSIAMMGGAAIPGLTGLGRAIGMFAYGDPLIAGVVLGIGAITAAINKLKDMSEQESKYIHESAEHALKIVQETKQFVSAAESDWNRLGELSGVGELTNAQNQEATAIIERLTEVYGYLGIEIDKASGKMTGYAEARNKANEQDRELQRETLRHAYQIANQNAKKQVEDFYNSTGDKLIRNLNKDLLSSLTDQTISDSEKQRAINLYKERLQRVMSDQEKMTYQSVTYEGSADNVREVTRTYAITKKEAADTLKNVEALEKVWKDANASKRALVEFDSKPVEEYSKEVTKLAKTLADSENKFTFDENGERRLKTNEELYKQQKERIAVLSSKIEEVNNEIASSTEKGMTILDNGKQAGVYLIELQTERNNLYEKTLTYEQRISEEKKKQNKSLNDAIDAEQMRLNQFKLGYVTDVSGAIVRQKNADELAKDRKDYISDLVSEISEIEAKGNNQTLADLKELVSKRLELAKLEAEQVKYTESVTNAQKANADKGNEYIFDKSGAVLRKKTEEEIRASRKKQIKDEIQEARKRLEMSEKGTLEYENARAKLTELEIESYNLRKKTNAANLMQNARAADTRMVRGIEAKSAEALALESRIFRRDDSEKAILKDTNAVQTDIKDIVSEMFATLNQLNASFNSINERLQPL